MIEYDKRVDNLLSVLHREGNLEELVESYLAIDEVFSQAHVVKEIEAIAKERIGNVSDEELSRIINGIKDMLRTGSAVAQTITSMAAMQILKESNNAGTVN
jgi:hypothetical protein